MDDPRDTHGKERSRDQMMGNNGEALEPISPDKIHTPELISYEESSAGPKSS